MELLLCRQRWANLLQVMISRLDRDDRESQLVEAVLVCLMQVLISIIKRQGYRANDYLLAQLMA